MKRLLLMFAIASSFLIAVQSDAQVSMPPPPPATLSPVDAEYKAARDRIAADYKAARAQCDTMKGNAKDVCIEEAKGKEKIARAQLDQQRKPSDSSARKVADARVKAAANVARAKCGAHKGDAKAACVKQAKAEEAKEKAEINATKK
jgi:hypothetical protein